MNLAGQRINVRGSGDVRERSGMRPDAKATGISSLADLAD